MRIDEDREGPEPETHRPDKPTHTGPVAAGTPERARKSLNIIRVAARCSFSHSK